MNDLDGSALSSKIRNAFLQSEIQANVTIRRFPGETIVIAEVDDSDFKKALELASKLDSQIEDGFITVKKRPNDTQKKSPPGQAKSLADPRINDLVGLLNERSRASENQPSLHYIQDVTQSLNITTSRRHHLIFGRRGVGKTALMVEAKRHVEAKGGIAFWMNLQTIRTLRLYEAFLSAMARLCELPETVHFGRNRKPLSVERATTIKARIMALLGSKFEPSMVDLLIPELQQLLKLLGEETQNDVFLFLDDFHYLPITEQPKFLDLIHSITRDTSTWIKAAGIRHQSRWFTDNPPIGLQTNHDASIVNLDITLEQPALAKKFLSDILGSYAKQVKLPSIFGAISHKALDRLVLASGGVPRDFLVLSSLAIQVAREKKARYARVQDVNEAAGRNAQPKLQELEDDAASSGSVSSRTKSLADIRTFLIDENQVTYFRVDFHDKETHPNEYALLQGLMDLRLIHLIHSSISDERIAGRRSEVYMLDLSQYSASRFKRNLKVLDFVKDHFVLKSTGKSEDERLGDTPNKLLGILRRGPAYALEKLEFDNSEQL